MPPVRVLSIDGGGIRGVIPAVVLADIERRTERPVASLFDFVAGTSTGGILACALTRPSAVGSGSPMYSAASLVDLYLDEGPNIFHRGLVKLVLSGQGWFDERYDDAGLMAALERYLGDARLRDCLVPIMVTAYDIEGRFAFFFRSSRAAGDLSYDFSLVEAARATAAAPTYFEPYLVTDAAGARSYPLVDGGVYAVNPAMCAYADCAGEGISVLASLGTGGQTEPIPVARARGWGQLGWARPLVDVVFDGVADTIEFQLGTLLGPERYVRLQTELSLASGAMDDASLRNLEALVAEGEKLVRERAREIDALCSLLVQE